MQFIVNLSLIHSPANFSLERQGLEKHVLCGSVLIFPAAI